MFFLPFFLLDPLFRLTGSSNLGPLDEVALNDENCLVSDDLTENEDESNIYSKSCQSDNENYSYGASASKSTKKELEVKKLNGKSD